MILSTILWSFKPGGWVEESNEKEGRVNEWWIGEKGL